jgi:cyclopropane-fatty-acyl-phospholipid synthase
MWYMRLVEKNVLPDWLIRVAIRSGLAWGRWQRARMTVEERSERKRALLTKLAQSPIAIHTDDPNRQHYEVPTDFFQLVLGKWLKYSCCYWPPGVETLDDAEEAMLRLTCQRAQIDDGLAVLDLGCGWGALSLWIGQNYPSSQIVAVSNSRTQKQYIEQQCRLRQLENVEVITADVASLALERQFDRVVSVEMFEHMKNYGLLMSRIATMLKPDGRLFVHIFSHRDLAYEFDASDPSDWMAQTFFTGGTMPSDDLLLYYQQDLKLMDHWCLDGTHYARTLRDWLRKLDAQKFRVNEVMAATYGADQATKWLAYWRLFFIACQCAWGSRGGREYLVSHYLFARSV